MGSKQPFERVVAEHGGTVLRVCRVLLGRHDADDAWSETFLAALRAYPDLPETANVEAWLVTIAHRKTIDVLRARGRQPVPVGELPAERAGQAGQAEPAGAGVPGGDCLWQAVRALPDKQRQAVAYHHVAGLPYAEIAQILGGTTEAARRAAADGIKNLRKNYPAGAHHDRTH
jgi:RNA polymerase sigma factor (sigma-70 family)